MAWFEGCGWDFGGWDAEGGSERVDDLCAGWRCQVRVSEDIEGIVCCAEEGCEAGRSLEEGIESSYGCVGG